MLPNTGLVQIQDDTGRSALSWSREKESNPLMACFNQTPASSHFRVREPHTFLHVSSAGSETDR